MLRRSDHDVREVPTNHKWPFGWWLKCADVWSKCYWMVDPQYFQTYINKNPTNTQQSRALFLTWCTCSQPLKTCFVRTSFQISCCRSTMDRAYLYIITCKDSEARHLLSWTPEPKIPSWASLSRSHIFKMPYFIRKTIDWISNLAHKCRPQVSLDGTLKSSPWHWWHWP